MTGRLTTRGSPDFEKMKRFAALALLALTCLSLTAADNYRQGDTRVTGSSDPVILRTTDTAGVHTPHVMIDSGGTGGSVPTGTAGTPSSSVVSVQGVASGTAIPASQSGTWNVTNISGTVSLPTGAATNAAQTTAQTSLTTIANSATGGATAGATLVNSSAYEASHVLKASAGTLVSVIGYNSKASAQFIQLYNSATVPADTAVPVCTINVAASSNFSVDVPITGMPFTTGIAVANSSTGPTKTVGSADCFFTAIVK